VRRRILDALRYPPPARSRGLTGTVYLEIFIESNGAIGDVAVTSSSSHPLLDEAALEAVRSLSPQPFPKGLKPRPLRVRLPVVFDLQ
jgi:protein TonB